MNVNLPFSFTHQSVPWETSHGTTTSGVSNDWLCGSSLHSASSWKIFFVSDFSGHISHVRKASPLNVIAQLSLRSSCFIFIFIYVISSRMCKTAVSLRSIDPEKSFQRYLAEFPRLFGKLVGLLVGSCKNRKLWFLSTRCSYIFLNSGDDVKTWKL